ncbi:MAG: DUF4339 domain-containing protein [Planctomycetes bacterium]|nr:DUF4339 domain-containing protein [Planctomycetota bacterium]
MSDPVWYLPGPDNQPAGPHTTEQILQKARAKRVNANTLCWRTGMPDWRPLAEIPEFREIAPHAGRAGARSGRAGAVGLGEPTGVWGRVVGTTRRKAKAVSLKLSIRQHNKRKHHILFELGQLLYTRGPDLLEQIPYKEIVQRVRDEDAAIDELREQIRTLEGHAEPTADSDQANEGEGHERH